MHFDLVDDERKAKTTWKVIYEIVHEEGLYVLSANLFFLYCPEKHKVTVSTACEQTLMV